MNKIILGLTVLPSFALHLSAQTQPNVVYVFPDQFRNAALGIWQTDAYRSKVNFRGDPTHTPRIERFAQESVVLTQAMSNCPLSSPHRGSLLTGMYPNKSGVPLNCNSDRPISYIRPETVCVSDVFHQAGYDCGYIGKLHADRPEPNDPAHPGQYVESRRPAWDAYTPKERRHGFTFWYSYGTFDEHKNPHYWDTNGVRHDPHEWSPVYEAKVASAYIRNANGERRAGKPFFLMVGMNPPHSPYRTLNDCMEEDYNLYRNLPIDSLLVRPNANRKLAKAQSAAYYFASVTGVDRAFGMILDAIHEAGLDDNTIVVFSSDHGETMCSQNTEDPKNSPYSESMNVPFIVRYPGHIRPHTDSLLLSSPDIMPTLLGLSGLHNDIPASVQGTDYSLQLAEQPGAPADPEGVLYFQNLDGNKDADGKVIDYFPSARGIKTHRYTLVFYIDRNHRLTRTLFFDDQADPYQMTNLNPAGHRKVFRQLCHLMGQKLSAIGDPWATGRILGKLIPYTATQAPDGLYSSPKAAR